MRRRLEKLSVIVLAGGKSRRIGSDKAFLLYRGRYFITLIVEEMSKLSNEVIVTIGKMEKRKFELALENYNSTIINDDYNLENPLNGILTAFNYTKNQYAAVVTCDIPLVKSEVMLFLYHRARKHSAAVPTWPDGYEERRREGEKRTEPLCAVYNVDQAREAALKASKNGKASCRQMVSMLPDVQYVDVTELQTLDKNLDSLMNINLLSEYLRLVKR
jgi:molybdopterin-guanine dinucleotide biosynthesis protein A